LWKWQAVFLKLASPGAALPVPGRLNGSGQGGMAIPPPISRNGSKI